jgi:WD40 repeat protein
MTLKKELLTRVIINTKVISPWYQNPNLHKEILDSKRAKKSQKDHNDETNLRLRPGDLDSDDDNNNTDLNNLDRVDPAAIHRDEYKNIQKLINKEQDKITTALNQQGSYELIQSKRSTTIPIVNCVDINPVNTNLIISGAERGDLRVWDSNTGEVMFVLHQNSSNAQNSPNLEPYHLGDITSVQWLHNGIMALSGSMDCTIKLWLAAQYGKCMKTFVGHNRAVVQVTQHHTYKNKIISIGKDGRLIVFNISHTGSSGSNGGVMVVPPENEFQIISDSLVNDFGETLHSFAIHPTNHDIIYVISSIGIHCVDLRLTRDEYYGKQKLQTDSKLEPPAPILTKQALLKCCFKPNSSPNHDDNVLYIGTNEGSVLKYSLPNTLLAQKIIDPEGDPILPVQKTNHKSYEEFSLFDEAITGMKWYNNELYVSTFQGDCCSLNENFTLQPVLLSGTDQPLRGVDVKFENEDEKDQNGANGGQNGCVKVVACGDDGVFVWKL